jgi:hypothetical protein
LLKRLRSSPDASDREIEEDGGENEEKENSIKAL